MTPTEKLDELVVIAEQIADYELSTDAVIDEMCKYIPSLIACARLLIEAQEKLGWQSIDDALARLTEGS